MTNRIGKKRKVRLTPEQEANNAAILARIEAEQRELWITTLAMQQEYRASCGNGLKPGRQEQE